MKEMFQNVNGAAVADLPRFMGSPGAGWGGTWGFIPSDKATVFINNWDSERGEHAPSSLVASNFTGVPNDTQGTKRYQLANVLMLAWPYGAAQVHSGFRFTRSEQPPPSASPFDANGNPLINQAWDFIHRWPEISNMVGFRAATSGQGVDNFTTGTRNQIAFRVATRALSRSITTRRPGPRRARPASRLARIATSSLASSMPPKQVAAARPWWSRPMASSSSRWAA
jgi:alpha-amylase